MSLFSTLNVGASGLGVSSSNLSVIGDNIANIGTVGFKSSTGMFADMIPQNVGGLAGPQTLGSGAIMNAIATSFGQGSIDGSSSSLDVAVSGAGMFQVNDGNESYYTRDGSFYMNADNFLVNAQGLTVQGFQATDGSLSSLISDIHIDTSPIPQIETSSVVLTAELAPQDDTTPLFPTSASLDGADPAFGGTALTIEEMAELADFTTSITIYDSLGQAHDATVMFEANGTNNWDYVVVVDGAEDGGDSGFALALSSGSMSFNSDGSLDPATFTETVVNTPTFDGADPFSFTLDVGSTVAGAEGLGSITQAGTESSVSAITQDGQATGAMLGISVDADGQIVGQYDNGEELILGQLGLAMFPALAGLTRVGGNLFAATLGSGDPAIGVAGTGGRGSTVGYALEGSNVDLETEFVNMIQTQRSYSANAGVIQTVDETLQELVALV